MKRVFGEASKVSQSRFFSSTPLLRRIPKYRRELMQKLRDISDQHGQLAPVSFPERDSVSPEGSWREIDTSFVDDFDNYSTPSGAASEVRRQMEADPDNRIPLSMIDLGVGQSLLKHKNWKELVSKASAREALRLAKQEELDKALLFPDQSPVNYRRGVLSEEQERVLTHRMARQRHFFEPLLEALVSQAKDFVIYECQTPAPLVNPRESRISGPRYEFQGLNRRIRSWFSLRQEVLQSAPLVFPLDGVKLHGYDDRIGKVANLLGIVSLQLDLLSWLEAAKFLDLIPTAPQEWDDRPAEDFQPLDLSKFLTSIVNTFPLLDEKKQQPSATTTNIAVEEAELGILMYLKRRAATTAPTAFTDVTAALSPQQRQKQLALSLLKKTISFRSMCRTHRVIIPLSSVAASILMTVLLNEASAVESTEKALAVTGESLKNPTQKSPSLQTQSFEAEILRIVPFEVAIGLLETSPDNALVFADKSGSIVSQDNKRTVHMLLRSLTFQKMENTDAGDIIQAMKGAIRVKHLNHLDNVDVKKNETGELLNTILRVATARVRRLLYRDHPEMVRFEDGYNPLVAYLDAFPGSTQVLPNIKHFNRFVEGLRPVTVDIELAAEFLQLSRQLGLERKKAKIEEKPDKKNRTMTDSEDDDEFDAFEAGHQTKSGGCKTKVDDRSVVFGDSNQLRLDILEKAADQLVVVPGLQDAVVTDYANAAIRTQHIVKLLEELTETAASFTYLATNKSPVLHPKLERIALVCDAAVAREAGILFNEPREAVCVLKILSRFCRLYDYRKTLTSISALDVRLLQLLREITGMKDAERLLLLGDLAQSYVELRVDAGAWEPIISETLTKVIGRLKKSSPPAEFAAVSSMLDLLSSSCSEAVAIMLAEHLALPAIQKQLQLLGTFNEGAPQKLFCACVNLSTRFPSVWKKIEPALISSTITAAQTLLPKFHSESPSTNSDAASLCYLFSEFFSKERQKCCEANFKDLRKLISEVASQLYLRKDTSKVQRHQAALTLLFLQASSEKSCANFEPSTAIADLTEAAPSNTFDLRDASLKSLEILSCMPTQQLSSNTKKFVDACLQLLVKHTLFIEDEQTRKKMDIDQQARGELEAFAERFYAVVQVSGLEAHADELINSQ